MLSCEVQRRHLAVIPAMHVGAPREHLLRRPRVALLGSEVERGDVVAVRLVEQLVVVPVNISQFCLTQNDTRYPG